MPSFLALVLYLLICNFCSVQNIISVRSDCPDGNLFFRLFIYFVHDVNLFVVDFLRKGKGSPEDNKL